MTIHAGLDVPDKATHIWAIDGEGVHLYPPDRDYEAQIPKAPKPSIGLEDNHW